MDIQKTLLVLEIILGVEKSNNIQWLFQNINSYIDQNNTEQIKNTKGDIYSFLEESEISNFVNTDIKILNFLWVCWYFDLSVINKFENILQSWYQIKSELNKFISERNEKLQNIQKLYDSLRWLWVELSEKDTDNYQIVFSFPEEYHNLIELEKVTKDIRFFLSYIDSKSPDEKWFKIASVNNWCIEFYIECTKFLVKNYTIAIDWLIRFYTLIKMFDDWKKLYDSYSTNRKKLAESIANEELEEKKKELLGEFVSSLEIANLTSEDKTKLSKLFVTLSTHIEKWVHTEVKTPILEEPQEKDISELDEEVRIEYESEVKNFEFKKYVDENNKKLFELQKENIQLQLPECKDEE